MLVAVVKEIKQAEARVALLPSGVAALVADGRRVLVESEAGAACGYSDERYLKAGARLVTAEEAWGTAEVVLKVKEPLEDELPRLREGQVLFTYLHLAANKRLTEVLRDKGVSALAYETVEECGRLPLLEPMSAIAGTLAAQVAGELLRRTCGGPGKLIGGAPGVAPAHVVVLGGGVVGEHAAKYTSKAGARVTVVEKNTTRIRALTESLPGVTTLFSDRATIQSLLPSADVVIGAVLSPGGKAPTLVTHDDLKLLPPGAILIDVAVDQGGCFSVTRPTSHAEPTFAIDHVKCYAVPNMPAAVANTATAALCGATLPFVFELAAKGFVRAVAENAALARGVNTHRGQITNKPVADAFGMPYRPLS